MVSKALGPMYVQKSKGFWPSSLFKEPTSFLAWELNTSMKPSRTPWLKAGVRSFRCTFQIGTEICNSHGSFQFNVTFVTLLSSDRNEASCWGLDAKSIASDLGCQLRQKGWTLTLNHFWYKVCVRGTFVSGMARGGLCL